MNPRETALMLMLEDDAERVARFVATLRAMDVGVELLVWRDAHAMRREAGPLLFAASASTSTPANA